MAYHDDINNIIKGLNINSTQNQLKNLKSSLQKNGISYQLKLLNEQQLQIKNSLKNINNPLNTVSFMNNLNQQKDLIKELIREQESVKNLYKNVLSSKSLTPYLNNPLAELNQFMENKNEIKQIILNNEFNNQFIELQKQLINTDTSLDFLKIVDKKYFSFEDEYKDSYKKLSKNIENKNIDIKDNNLVIKTEDNKTYDYCNQKDVIELPEILPNLTKNEVINFLSFLRNYPLLGMKNETGQKIFNGLKQLINTKSKILEKNHKLYRSRPWEKEQENPFTTDEMWAPPMGIANMQRFNPSGVSYLYMANSEKTSKAELGKKRKYSMIESFTRHPINYLDISDSNCYIFQLCNKKRIDSNYNPKEYLIPNFIAQCLSYMREFENIEINGIKYKSTKNPDDFCFVFFGITQFDFAKTQLINDEE